jgi:hypothetical protein
MGNTNQSSPSSTTSENVEVLQALDELKHSFARALQMAMLIDDGACGTSMELISAYDSRLAEIRTMKQMIGARA